MTVDETPNEGGIGVEEREKTPQEKIDEATAEMFPHGDPAQKEQGPQQGADTGAGLKKGQGPPPGSVGKGEDTVQTPPT
jgi:hypothetical protein